MGNFVTSQQSYSIWLLLFPSTVFSLALLSSLDWTF